MSCGKSNCTTSLVAQKKKKKKWWLKEPRTEGKQHKNVFNFKGPKIVVLLVKTKSSLLLTPLMEIIQIYAPIFSNWIATLLALFFGKVGGQE